MCLKMEFSKLGMGFKLVDKIRLDYICCTYKNKSD